MRAKAIGLLSGGLDSNLAVKLMLDQEIEVVGLNFITPFSVSIEEAIRAASKFGIELKVITFGEEYMEMIKNPRYGYGKNMNPCIDCRILQFKRAREYMDKTGASFVFTGEVLGERPMSQRRDAINIIEKASGLKGLILRPLSAKLLPPTIPEKEGLIDRERLLAIFGRKRDQQIALAGHFGISFPSPAGGCRLTDPNFAVRLKEAFDHDEDGTVDMHLLRYGRHFRLNTGAKVIVGRNESENEQISNLAQEGDRLLEVIEFGSPVTLLKGAKDEKDISVAASICARYSDCDREEMVKVSVEGISPICVKPMDDGQLSEFRIGSHGRSGSRKIDER